MKFNPKFENLLGSRDQWYVLSALRGPDRMDERDTSRIPLVEGDVTAVNFQGKRVLDLKATFTVPIRAWLLQQTPRELAERFGSYPSSGVHVPVDLDEWKALKSRMGENNCTHYTDHVYMALLAIVNAEEQAAGL